MPLACVDEDGMLDHMFGELAAGRGGWLITANLDFLRRFAKEPQMRALYRQADVMVADGMPLVWASRLQGDPLPERVAGSALIYRFADRAAAAGLRIYLLGGEPGAGQGAADALQARASGLQICGCSAPRISDPPTLEELASVRAELERARPDLLLVALGSPKQERLIAALRPHLPRVWMVGVGIALSYVAGQVSRAPAFMRTAGLEWVHRLAQEPRRLARRYLVDDLPFAVELFARALVVRVQRKSGS
jgi:N-acetylglucosaminyldiphosphoundecaprenol N-acetyl-beta-D-mannosaminyltransferase